MPSVYLKMRNETSLKIVDLLVLCGKRFTPSSAIRQNKKMSPLATHTHQRKSIWQKVIVQLRKLSPIDVHVFDQNHKISHRVLII